MSMQPMPNTGLRGLNRGERDAFDWEDIVWCDKADVDVVAVDAPLIDDTTLIGELIRPFAVRLSVPIDCVDDGDKSCVCTVNLVTGGSNGNMPMLRGLPGTASDSFIPVRRQD